MNSKPDEFEFEGETDLESPFEEFEEMEYAAELLSIQSEEELDQFLGKLIKRAGRGLSKIGKVFRPLGGVLKGLAKKALPFVGGALGSFIPIPGVGTAVGTALGSAVSKALEAEFEGYGSRRPGIRNGKALCSRRWRGSETSRERRLQMPIRRQP